MVTTGPRRERIDRLKEVTLLELVTPGGSKVETRSTGVDRVAVSPGCRCLRGIRARAGGTATALSALCGADPRLVGL